MAATTVELHPSSDIEVQDRKISLVQGEAVIVDAEGNSGKVPAKATIYRGAARIVPITSCRVLIDDDVPDPKPEKKAPRKPRPSERKAKAAKKASARKKSTRKAPAKKRRG